MEQSKQELVANCPVCATSAFTPALTVLDYHTSQERFELVDCTNCGLRLTNPRPADSELARYYSSSQYLSHDTSRRGFLPLIYRTLRNRALRRKHALVSSHSSAGSILDVGCGTGEFLAYLKLHGFTAQGVEPSARARSFCAAQHSIRAVPALSDLNPQEAFDVITLWHVLEHLPSLGDDLRAIHAHLAPKGALFIAVPDRSSWDAHHYGARWAAWDVPRHLWHFRQSDLAALLKEHGLRVVSTRRMWLDAYFIALLSERYRGRPSWLAWPLALLYGSISNAYALLGGRSTSSTLIVAQRQAS